MDQEDGDQDGVEDGHAVERLVIIILAISQYSIFDTRYGFGLAKQTGIVRNL